VKILSSAGAFIALLFVIAPASAADDPDIQSLATCKESWLDWSKSGPERWNNFGNRFRAEFSRHENDPSWLPKTDKSILGLHISQAFPDSVGMGVGFSVVVDAPFDKARKVFEKELRKTLQKCEASDNMRSCELDIAEKRTFTLMAEDNPKAAKTLVGCYYYYEK
jgi:hypothetical protein